MIFFIHRRRIPAYLAMIIAIGLSTLPPDFVEMIMHMVFGPAKSQSSGLIPIDKVIHMSLYTLVGFSFAAAISSSKWARNKVRYALYAAILASVFGVCDEGYQLLSDRGRQFDLFDIVADILGSFIGVVLFYWKGSGLKNRISEYLASESG
ncbi:MAG: VanZ family protein [Fibrobacterales bacterium]